MGEDTERGQWSGKLDFLLSSLGFAVGLGNVWRFPYLCFKHGGGAFLIPYCIMLLFIGIPCFFLEITIGQYAAMGPVTIYSNLSPLFKGLGFANFLASVFVALYYNMIIAWTIYYLFSSFTSQLPWDSCDNDFNSPYCFNINGFRNCSDSRENGTIPENSIYYMGKCLTDDKDLEQIKDNFTYFYGCEYKDDNGIGLSGMYYNETHCGADELFPGYPNPGIEDLFDIPVDLRVSAAEEYLNKDVLNVSEGIEYMGVFQWKLTLCLLTAWIIIFLCLIKGIKSSGRVVYFTATFPYFVLIILLIKAVTLPGAIDGIRFYIIPDLSRLSDIKVWEAAAVQIFFSLSVAGGGLITLASYNPFKNNVIRDTMIVCFGNCLTSFVAGFAIFSVLGFMAGELGLKVEDVAVDGSGLAFVAYPDLVTRLPGAPFWSFLFFAMLFTLGLDSQFAIVETILTGITDFKPSLRSKKIYLIGGICTIGFLCGLPLTQQGGSYLLDLLDYYAAGWPYLFIGLCELIIISHIYGIENFVDDLCAITNVRFNQWMRTHFYFIFQTLSPAIIAVILLISWASHKPLTKGDYEYPQYANDIGMAIAMIAILAVPFMAIVQFLIGLLQEYKRPDFDLLTDAPKVLYNLSQPTENWRTNAKANLESAANGKNNGNGEMGYDNQAVDTKDTQF